MDEGLAVLWPSWKGFALESLDVAHEMLITSGRHRQIPCLLDELEKPPPCPPPSSDPCCGQKVDYKTCPTAPACLCACKAGRCLLHGGDVGLFLRGALRRCLRGQVLALS